MIVSTNGRSHTFTHALIPQSGLADDVKAGPGGPSLADVLGRQDEGKAAKNARANAKKQLLVEFLKKRLPGQLRDVTDARGRVAQVPVKEDDADAVTLDMRRAEAALNRYAVTFFAEQERPFNAYQLYLELERMEGKGQLGKGKVAALFDPSDAASSSSAGGAVCV